jgi:hypothetical protein
MCDDKCTCKLTISVMICIAYLFNERPEGQPSYMPLGKKVNLKTNRSQFLPTSKLDEHWSEENKTCCVDG